MYLSCKGTVFIYVNDFQNILCIFLFGFSIFLYFLIIAIKY